MVEGPLMRTAIERLVESFRAWKEPRDGLTNNPFRLACSLEESATDAEISTAGSGIDLPGELEEFWRQSRSARLFEDLDYGQWGLRILAPDQSLDRTAAEQRDRPDDIRATDLVVGEFLGDRELLVLALDEEAPGVLIALPLDPRVDWYRAGATLADFLERYLNAVGEKFWE